MFVDSCTYNANSKKYTRHLLRESYREHGKVKHRTIGNILQCSPEEIQALKLALKHKENLQQLGDVNEDILVQQGLAVGRGLSRSGKSPSGLGYSSVWEIPNKGNEPFGKSLRVYLSKVQDCRPSDLPMRTLLAMC